MTDERLTPEEFARLMALPVDHPDLRRAARTPEFEARTRLLQDFESSAGRPEWPGAVAAAGREVEARLARAIGASVVIHATTPAAAVAGDPARHPATPPRQWQGRGTAPERSRHGANLGPALAFAAALVVVSGAVWLVARPPHEPVVRGGSETPVLELIEPRFSAHAVELHWTAAPGADNYRVEFFGSDMTEIARVEGLRGTTLELRTSALPVGLVAGREVLAVVTALRGPDPITSSRPRVVTLPH